MKKYLCVGLMAAMSASGAVFAAENNEIEAAVGSLVNSINASVAKQLESAEKQVEEARKNGDRNANATIITCSDKNGGTRNIQVQGGMNNTVIVNCRMDENGQPHITVKGDGAVREIGAVRIENGAGNMRVINSNQLGTGSEIVVDGKNAKASVGNVEVKSGKLNNTTIINNAVINGSTMKAIGDGVRANSGSIVVE
ncbi:MAG: hypothetical protein LBU39_09095 [Desulfobulbaceae bacterium]|jgi:hypothetical protein|nr:hypothetical protein [Desulfobulbaceae bacterium]